jgi:penicillin-binding protein 2
MLSRTTRIQQPRAARRRRSAAARVIIFGLMVFLLVPLYRLQVVSADQFALQAKQNRMRPMIVRAPRGTIYDRHGRIVAENTVGYQVLLMPKPLDQMRAEVARLAPILEMDSADVVRAFRRYSLAPHLPMEVHRDASPIAVSKLAEHRYEFPEVLVQEYPKRNYPAGEAIAHFIGYVNEISEQELTQPEFTGYQQGRWIGKAGLEKQYEKHIGGEPGVQYLEIDARGRIKQWLPEELGVPPIPGNDLQLYLDLDLQEYIVHIFPKEYTGAIVAIDPRDGGVLAYYSHPTYDPNRFIGGISTAYWNELQQDPGIPLLDRVVASGQPAASTWKLAVAGMALDQGVIRPDEYMPIPCTGGITYGRYARCWNPSGHGRMNLIEGIKNSCNVYFYQLGIRLGLKRFLETGTRLGFAEKTGIDVPHEISPKFPESTDWWVRNLGYEPKDNEVLSLTIGQGPLTMTAIKLAHIYSALVQPDGKVPAPRLAMGMDTQRDTFHFALDPRETWYLEAGMRRVLGPGGTAALSRLQDFELIGKTGTAQPPGGGPLDHAWFVGMGRPVGGEFEIAITMFLEYGHHGYLASGFVAEAINFYLARKYGKEFQMYATPRLRFANNLPVNWNFSAPVVDPPMPAAVPQPQAGGQPAAPPGAAGQGTGPGGR